MPTLGDTAATYDARAATYDDSAMHRAVAAAVVDVLDPRSGELLVDVCGGTGLVARQALPSLGGAVVVDASPGMLAAARRADPRPQVVRGDAHHLPLRDGVADAVTLVTALHLLDPVAALSEAVRVCRPGGRVVFTTWAADGWSVGRQLRQAARTEGVALADPTMQTTPARAAGSARTAGLGDVTVREVRHAAPPEADATRRVRQSDAARGLHGLPPDLVEAVWRRCEQAVLADGAVEHVLLVVRGRTSLASGGC